MKPIDKIEYIQKEMARTAEFLSWFKLRFDDMELSEDATVDLTACIPYFWVHNRKDLQTLLRLAQKWDKAPQGKSIRYFADVDGHSVCIFASDGALPATCRTVTERRIVAAVPEHEEITERIICDVQA